MIVGGPSGPHGAEEMQRVTRMVDPSAWATTSASCRPSPTTCCPPTTGRPTPAWSRAGRSRSGWSPWRRPPAGRRWWHRRSAGSPPSSTTARTGFLVDGRDPAVYARHVARIVADRSLADRMAAAAAARAGRLHLVHVGRPAAPAVRRPRRHGAWWSAGEHAGRLRSEAARPASGDLIDAGGRPHEQKTNARRRRRRPRRPGAARWYVRLGARRSVTPSGSRCGQRTLHYETYFMPAPEENHRRSSTSTCCGATAKLFGVRLRHRRRGRRLPGRPDAAVGASTRTSSTASSARPTPRPSSSSGRPCASATPVRIPVG